jgi:hypothetical protein
MGTVNDLYEIGLEQEKAFLGTPNDDDGSFINAGIRPAVMNIGSFPYGDPNYHTLLDRPEDVDIGNVEKAIRLTLAAVMHLSMPSPRPMPD